MEILSLILLFVILILSVALLSILFYYVRLLKRLNLQERELKKHYLKKARTEASEIVEEAGQEALEMLSSSRTVSEKDQALVEAVVKQIVQDQSAFLKTSISQLMQEFNSQLVQIKDSNVQALTSVSKEITDASFVQANDYNKALSQVKLNTEKIVQELNTQLQQLKNNNINILTNISKDIEANTSAQVDSYVKTIEDETIASEKMVSNKVNDGYKKVEEEIQTYKNEQIKKIDANISALIGKLTAEVFEKSISPADHRDLIMKTLEKAKTENIFTN